jgi:uncharacterized protein YdeI (BOF family)
MKTTIVLAVLLATTPAFAAQQGSSYGYGQGSPGATMQDYKAGPHKQRTTKKPAKMQKQAAPTQTPSK